MENAAPASNESNDGRNGRSTFFLARWIFLRLLGLIFLIAFLSYWSQLDGLIGSQGILPAQQFVDRVEEQLGGVSLLEFPTLCWISASDGFLHALCGIGVVLSVMLIVGAAPLPVLALLWVLYLSLVVVGQRFFSFQWDTLLLETALFALFLAPGRLLPGLRREGAPTRLGIWLQWGLLFKLMFLSGITKLLSGDDSWVELTALPEHYESQPLPTWAGWHAFHLPEWFQDTSLVVMFVIELAVPFLILCPRLLRHIACVALLFLQVTIAITGNYTFFNLLTVTLCVLLLDDRFLGRIVAVVPFFRRWTSWIAEVTPRPRRRWLVWLSASLAAPLVVVSALAFLEEMTRTQRNARRMELEPNVPGFVVSTLDVCDEHVSSWAEPHVLRHVGPFRTINGYGLFRSMTTDRCEIVIEGSEDSREWKEYEFAWKPGDVEKAPGLVAPHQPRLDWQMWFAALSVERRRFPGWLGQLCRRLLEGSPDVLDLLETNPFPEAPPTYLRLVYYRYRFTDPETRSRTGQWWSREMKGQLLARPLTLRDF
jgi:uncharacterized membrane protein YphA (DoxX/SURF4 family)